MNISRRSLLSSIGAAGATLTFAGFASAASGEAQYLVVSGGNGVTKRLERSGFSVTRELADGAVSIVHGPADAADDLASINGVSEAVRDVQFQLEQPARTALPDSEEDLGPTFYEEYLWDKQVTQSVEANEIATGKGASVAVIDTGCDYRHPDLTPNLQTGKGRRFKNGNVDSGTEEDIVVGRPAPEDSNLDFDIDFVEQNVADDVEGHGTHVGGIATAAADEGAVGTGVTGTAPDADLIPYRVFWWIKVDEDADRVDKKWGPTTTTGDILAAIDMASEEGYDAANLSLGTPPLPPRVNSTGFRVAYQKVIQRATQRGTLVVASAGNAATNLQQGGLFSLPNSTAGAMSISATAPNDELAFYSNYGTNEIDVGAPGGGYETEKKTLATDTAWPFPKNLVFSTISPRVEGAAYGWKAGTSMAAPQVAGAAALIRELAPEANAKQVESAIKAGAEGTAGRSDPELSAGRLNVLNSVEQVEQGNNGRGQGNGN